MDQAMVSKEDWERIAQLAELGVLSASLIHELRQPLFAVKGALQLARARGGSVSDDVVEALESYVDHMEGLIDDYAALGQAGDRVTFFDLNDSVRWAMDILAHRGREVGARVDLELTDHSLMVQARPTAARQVAVNLIHNAYDAVAAEAERRVWVRSARRDDRVLFTVQDSGPGIPEHMRGTIFEPFVTTKPAGQGTGLGLYIARKLVTEANGDLRLIFPAAGGMRVEVDLPAAA